MYGIQVDEFCFRYIPGGSPKTELNGTFEIGDYNYNSNKWINLTNFFVEERYGTRGGMSAY